MSTTWPVATLSDMARLRLLAEGLPGVALHERHIAAPFDAVWALVSDFEQVPTWDTDVTSVEIIRQDGERLDIRSAGPWWLRRMRFRFDVEIRPGWCFMVSRPQRYIVGMAAEPEGEGTRFLHLEGVLLPGPSWLRPLVRPLLAISRWRHRHHVPRDVDGVERRLGLRGAGSPPASAS
jgi:hypothetical protein